MKALVVDDSVTLRLMLRHLLRAQGFEVQEALNGAEALQMMKQGFVPDLVSLDWNMPVMNGGATLDAIRQDHAFDSAKILMVSSEAEQSMIEAALRCGSDEYLMKPISGDSLTQKLEMLGFALDSTQAA